MNNQLTILKKVKCLFLTFLILIVAFLSCIPASATRYLSTIVEMWIPSEREGGFQMNVSEAWLSSPLHPNADIAEAYYVRSYCNSSQIADLNTLNSTWDAAIPTATRLSGATPFYNCHSYAWFSQDTVTNQYWLASPEDFYSGEGYVETTSPKVGDIICYMAFGSLNKHSGIIVEVLSSSNGNLGDQYIVESKWGAAGLYRHNGYECPYTRYYPTDGYIPASSVRFYTRVSHTHSHTTYTDYGSLSFHESKCSCGQIIHEAHRWVSSPTYPSGQYSPNYVPQSVCQDCGAVALNPIR